MSAADSTADALSPMAKKAMYLSHFTPSMMPPETLQAMLVQRGPLLQRTVGSVVHSVETAAKHHHLFVGPRGIGKTHLISLIHHQISQNSAVQSKALIAWMREEEWGVTSFMELVLRILRTLDQTYPELGIDAQTQALYELSIAQAEEQATQILLQTLGDKTLVILLENLDDLFDQLKPTSQKQLRALIQNYPQFVLIATTPSLFTAVISRASAFYGFFEIDPMEGLGFEEVVELLGKVALERGDVRLAAFIQGAEGRARIRAIHHLAEGNPRIYIIFAQFLTEEALDELVQAFMHTLDELTPYYQSRMKELSGQQRKIVEYLVRYRGAATVKQIARSCFITQQVCSSQLKQLREKRTVRSIEKGRESYYELAEPLMRLCMEVKQQRAEPIGLFVEMLRIWYTESDLEKWLDAPDDAIRVERKYLEAALGILRSQKVEPSVKAILRDLDQVNASNGGLALMGEFVCLKTKNEHIKRIQSIARLVFNDLDGGNWIEGIELGELVDDVTCLYKQVSAIKFDDKKAAERNFGLFLAASIAVHRKNPVSAKPLLQELGAVMAVSRSTALRVIVRSMYGLPKPESTWLLDLLQSFPGGEQSREYKLMAKKIIKVMDALTASIKSGALLDMLTLAREERQLVEEMFARYMALKDANVKPEN